MSVDRDMFFYPMIYAFVAVFLGCLLDLGISPLFDPKWCLGAMIGLWCVCVCLWGWAFRQRKLWTNALLFLLITITAATRHHLTWNWQFDQAIEQWASEQPRPLIVRGRIATQPKWVADRTSRLQTSQTNSRELTKEFGAETRSQFLLTVESISVNSIHPDRCDEMATGTIKVSVSGQLSGFYVGDRVELHGRLAKIRGPTNPGQFDFQRYFQGKGIRCWFSVSHPEGVLRLGTAAASWTSAMSRWRVFLDQMIWTHVSPERAPLASAILLGNREQLDALSEQQFLLTGTIHLLAISGLHVGILAMLASGLARFSFVSRRAGLWVTVIFVFLYAWLVEFRPPVLRAAVLIAIVCFCKGVGRQSFSWNTLSAAGLIIFAINPAELYSSGAQLSFLAVGCLIYFRDWLVVPPTTEPIEKLIQNTRPWYQKCWKRLVDQLKIACLASALIWLVALPLVASQYHVIAPISLLINPLLLFPLTVVMLSGLGVLLFGWGAPALADCCGQLLDGSLAMIQWMVASCQQIPCSHMWDAGPTPIAVSIFYSVLAIEFLFQPLRRAGPLWVFLVLLWSALGWGWPTWEARYSQRRHEQFAGTFINVGHGSSVLLQLPEGRNVLYDCGTLGGPDSACRQVSSVLWYERIYHLDAVVISHADADHFNGMFGLLERFSIGEFIVSQALLDKRDHTDVQRLLIEVKSRGIPIRTMKAGDLLNFGSALQVNVLGPPATGFAESDNADSLIWDLQYADFRLLLAGDVEGAGLAALMAHPAEAYDIVMVPHHGSLRSSPVEFLAWAQPENLIICARQADTRTRYIEATQVAPQQVWQTGIHGAIRFEVDMQGKSHLTSWRSKPGDLPE